MALPGSGSLMAGRISGYPQLFLAIGGMVVTSIFGLRAVYWILSNWSRLHDPAEDPFAIYGDMWRVLSWAFLGIAIFGFGWLWALASSLGILRSAKNEVPTPPRLP